METINALLDWLEHKARLIRLRLIQIALHDADLTGNAIAARHLAREEVTLRAELEDL